MRAIAMLFLASALSGCVSFKSFTGTGLVKVLPNFLDEEGQHTDGVTLLHRDSYQKVLWDNPKLVRGVRYDVNWYGSGEVLLRLELRSSKAGVKPMKVEEKISASVPRSHWTGMTLDEATYKKFGQPQAWRISIWKEGEELAQLKSFLW